MFLAAPSARAAEDRNAKAKSEFETASKYFDAEEYEAALPHFEKAYELSNRRPAAIFALAQCERALKKYEAAIKHFNEYLRTGPSDAKQVKETVKLLEELRDNAAGVDPKKRAQGDETPDLNAAPVPMKPLDSRPIVEKNVEVPVSKPLPKPIEKPAEKPAEKPIEKPAEPAIVQPVAQPVADKKPEPQIVAKNDPPVLEAQPLPPDTGAIVRPPEEKSESLISSPLLWIGAGVAVVAGAVAIGFLARSKEAPYGGNSGVVIDPH